VLGTLRLPLILLALIGVVFALEAAL